MEQLPFDNVIPGLSLNVHVCGARGIKPSCLGRDSFVELVINDSFAGRTRVLHNENNPRWEEAIHMALSDHPLQDILQVFVFGAHWYGREFLGRVVIPVSLLMNGTHDSWLKLLPKNRFCDPKNTTPGFVHLRLTVEPSALPALANDRPPAYNAFMNNSHSSLPQPIMMRPFCDQQPMYLPAPPATEVPSEKAEVFPVQMQPQPDPQPSTSDKAQVDSSSEAPESAKPEAPSSAALPLVPQMQAFPSQTQMFVYAMPFDFRYQQQYPNYMPYPPVMPQQPQPVAAQNS